MSSAPLFLLPPSEGKAAGGRRSSAPDRFARKLGERRALVRSGLERALAEQSEQQLSRLLKVRGPLLERAVEASKALVAGRASMMVGWQRYIGVVWDYLDPASLDPEARVRMIVPSGLYGLTTAQDVIADYRLAMNVSLPGVGNLARFWAPSLTEILRTYTRRPAIINLLPTEHQRAINFANLTRVIDVQFVQADGTGAAGHRAKAAKGRFARYLIDEGVDEALGFRFEGWQIAPTATGFLLAAPK